jgi:hypothetical protein
MPLGINIAQYSLLRMIQRRQAVSLTELGGIAELDRSTVGRNMGPAQILDCMLTDGLNDAFSCSCTTSVARPPGTSGGPAFFGGRDHEAVRLANPLDVRPLQHH